jgi:hypothetical protein
MESGQRPGKGNKDKDLMLATWNVRSLYRIRWLNDVEEDLRMLGVKRWRRKALEGEEWAFVIKEAKVKLKEP